MAKRVSPPNKGLELTAYSVRCAPASGSSSGPAFGVLDVHFVNPVPVGFGHTNE
jgi:hypothetical protein